MKIYIAGHRGMVGGAILRQLQARKDAGADLTLITRTSAQLDLTDQAAVRDFFQAERPDQVILAAAKGGGIVANNSYPAQFIYENLMIECNVIHQAYAAGVTRLLQLGSSCIYPKLAEQPMREDALLTGVLEPTNEPYAIAKIAGIKLCESYNRQYGTDYRSVMPTNLYGPGDNFHPENSHVLPALLRRFHTAAREGAAEVVVWGSGKPMREFLHVDDLADAGEALRDAITTASPGRFEVLPEQLGDALQLVRDAARACVSGFPKEKPGEGDGDPGRQQAKGSVQDVFAVAERMAADLESDVLWLSEGSERSAPRLCVAPLQVWSQMRDKLLTDKTVVMTSATLMLGGDFSSVATSVGLKPSERVVDGGSVPEGDGVLPWRGVDVGSPFDYGRQGILYVARHLPPPGRDGLVKAQLDEIAATTGIDGALLTWPDFVDGVTKFGERVKPLLREAAQPATT